MQITYWLSHALRNVQQQANLGLIIPVVLVMINACVTVSGVEYLLFTRLSVQDVFSVASCGVELPKYDPTARYVYSVDIGGVNEQ